MSATPTGLVPELFTTVLVAAKAHEYVDARDLQVRARAIGHDYTVRTFRKLLDDAGYPCYAGLGGRAVIMGVQFR